MPPNVGFFMNALGYNGKFNLVLFLKGTWKSLESLELLDLDVEPGCDTDENSWDDGNSLEFFENFFFWKFYKKQWDC